MRTRKASIIETVFVWIFILITLIFGSTYYFSQQSKFKKKQQELEANKSSEEMEILNLTKDLKGHEAKTGPLKAQLEEKREKTQIEENDYNEKKKELEQKIAFLIPPRLKADLTEKILKLAANLNVQILSLKDNREEIIKNDAVKDIFKEYHFKISFSGVYEDVKKYLFRLENVLLIEDDNKTVYRALTKIKTGGLTIQDLSFKLPEEKHEKMRLELNMITYFRIEK
jgi:hypothetical protein